MVRPITNVPFLADAGSETDQSNQTYDGDSGCLQDIPLPSSHSSPTQLKVSTAVCVLYVLVPPCSLHPTQHDMLVNLSCAQCLLGNHTAALHALSLVEAEDAVSHITRIRVAQLKAYIHIAGGNTQVRATQYLSDIM